MGLDAHKNYRFKEFVPNIPPLQLQIKVATATILFTLETCLSDLSDAQ